MTARLAEKRNCSLAERAGSFLPAILPSCYPAILMLIECVPNVSEGRRAEVIARMAEALRDISGVRLLDHSSDPSHNRSVFTLVGDAAGIERSVLTLFGHAVADIDLRTHHGEHPRLGAVDVVPLIPIDAATMEDCVALAKRVGAEVASR